MPKADMTKWFLIPALAIIFIVAACGGGGEPEEVVFDLQISDQGLVGSEPDLEVKQDDEITFNVTSDSPANFHLHGYDHELDLSPNVTGSFSFTADATGSFPITIHIGAESGGEGHHSMGAGVDHHELTMGTPIDMSVGVEATLDGTSAANLKITTEGFTFAPENVNGPHVDGEGHAHVYVDGVKINRVYGPWYHLGGLAPGERSIRITLNANSHEQYAKGDHPVEATTTLLVPGEAVMDGEHQMSETSTDNPIELELGRLVVLPR